jgi:hypothetical protein
LEHRLFTIRLAGDPAKLQRELIDLALRYEHITAYEAARQHAELEPAGIERELRLLAVEHEFHRLTDTEYQKQRAGLKNEPWISVINSGFDPEQGIEGVFFEFDWNQQWIEFLRVNGYVGRTDEQVVDDWFADVCRSHSQISDLSVPFSIAGHGL